MFVTLKSLAATLLMPLPVALVLVLLGAWVAIRGWRRTGFSAMFAGFLLVFVASWNPVADRLLEPLEQAYAPIMDARAMENLAAIVVLSGGWEPNAAWPEGTRLGESSVHRLMEGIRLVQALPGTTLVVTGGTGRREDGFPTAQGYAAAAQALGIPAERIVPLDTTTDTASEAYAVREFLGTGTRFVLVTSASHMPRAVRHFERVGLAPIASPTYYLTGRDGPDRLRYWLPSAQATRKTERAVYEYMGLWALGWNHREHARRGEQEGQ